MAYYQDLEMQRDLDQASLERHVDIEDLIDDEESEGLTPDQVVDEEIRARVQTLIENIAADAEQDPDNVDPESSDVEDLVLELGFNSWAALYKAWKKPFSEYFKEKKVASHTTRKIELLTKHGEKLDEKIKEVEKKAAKHEKMLNALYEEQTTLELELESDEDDEDAGKRLRIVNKKIKELEALNFDLSIEDLHNQVRINKAKIKYYTFVAEGRNPIILDFAIDSDQSINAMMYNAVAQKAIWQLAGTNGCYQRLEKATESQTQERYSSSDMGIPRYAAFNFEDTGGGVYEKATDRQEKINDEIIHYLSIIEACKIGFEKAEAAHKPAKGGRDWFPDKVNLGAEIQRAALNAAKTRAKKALEERNAARKRKIRTS